jgi:hypothetical protein
MSCVLQSPWLNLRNDIWRWVHTVQLPLCSCYFIPLGQNILLRTLYSNTRSLCSSLSMRDQVLHPYNTTGRIMSLYILTFTFLDSRWDDKRLWTEW